MKTLSATLLALISVVLVMGTAVASDGAVPLYAASSISESGTYRLTRDVSVSSSTAFTINAADVTIDLAGHTITATGGTAFYLNANNCTLRVRNGLVRASYAFNTYMKAGIHVEAKDLEITTTSGGIAIALTADEPSLDIRRVRFLSDSADRAIQLQGDSSNQGRVAIRDSYFESTLSGTISLVNTAGLRFENNVLRGHGYASDMAAVHVEGCGGSESVVFTGNEIQLTSGSGSGLLAMYIDSAFVADNVIMVPGTGIQLSSQTSIIRGNSVYGADLGLKAYNRAVVADNLLSACDTGLMMMGSAVVYKDNSFLSTFAISGTGTDGGGNVGN